MISVPKLNIFACIRNGTAPPVGTSHFNLDVGREIILFNKLLIGVTFAEFEANLLDIHNQRLQGMNENNVDFVSII